jgi:hypothetical protein
MHGKTKHTTIFFCFDFLGKGKEKGEKVKSNQVDEEDKRE